MRENGLKIMIQQDVPVIGSFLTLADASVVELLGLAGYDFAILDMEHSSLDYQTVENMNRAADMVGISTLVRVGQNQENVILRVMESGAGGVIVPHVVDRESALRAVHAVKYGPIGSRGIAAMGRAARWGTLDLREHMRISNEQTMVVPMVEDREGIENIDEILAVEGVDVVLIGPGDLAGSYGVAGEKDPPVIREAVEHAVAAARRIGKARLGIPASHPAFNRGYKQLAELGVRLMICSSDAVVLAKAWRENLSRLRET